MIKQNSIVIITKLDSLVEEKLSQQVWMKKAKLILHAKQNDLFFLVAIKWRWNLF